MTKIAIYDLDRTITRLPTFTPFLIFAARADAPWRLLFLPLWLIAMLGYRIGFYSRKTLKQWGIALFVGRRIEAARIASLSQQFAEQTLANNIRPGAKAAIANDKTEGRRLVIATAAPEFYASRIGALLGFHDIIATRHIRLADGSVSNRMVDENCYGAAKLKQIENWMAENDLARAQSHIRFYSDHHSDKPTFDWADEAIMVAGARNAASIADASGWKLEDWLG